MTSGGFPAFQFSNEFLEMFKSELVAMPSKTLNLLPLNESSLIVSTEEGQNTLKLGILTVVG